MRRIAHAAMRVCSGKRLLLACTLLCLLFYTWAAHLRTPMRGTLRSDSRTVIMGLDGRLQEGYLWDEIALPSPVASTLRIEAYGSSERIIAPLYDARIAGLHLWVSDVGLDPTLTERAIQLPREVGLVFSPYTPDPERWIARARAAGHSIALLIPVHTFGMPWFPDQEPWTLHPDFTVMENMARMKSIVDSLPSVSWIALRADGKFVGDAAGMAALLDSCQVRHHGLIDAAKTFPPSASMEALALHVPLDLPDAIVYTAEQVAGWEDIWQHTLRRVAEGHHVSLVLTAYPSILDALTRGLPVLQEHHVRLLPFE